MNTEKIEKLKKSLSSGLLPADLKPKIEAEIKRLEDLDSKQPTKTVAKKTSKAKPSKTSTPKRTAMSLAKEIRKDGESWTDAVKRAGKMMKDKSNTATKDVETELTKLAEGGYLTDPTFGTFQNQVFAKGGSLSEVYDVDINYKQIKGYLGRFPMTEKTAEKLSDTFYFMYFDLYDTTDKKPMSYNQVSKIVTESMKEKGLYKNGGGVEQKKYNMQFNVGKAKYVINTYDGVKKNKDGSEFYDIHIFKTKSDLDEFQRKLIKDGYKYSYADGGGVEDVSVIYVDNYPYYIKKMGDSTHFRMANSKEGADIVIPSHIMQHRGEIYYEDVRSWLKGGANPDGNKYMSNDSYAKGGGIPNNYEGRTPEDVWNNLTEEQREHFLTDHKNHVYKYGKLYDSLEQKRDIMTKNYSELSKNLRLAISDHIEDGQYAKGGNINENKTKMRKQKLKKGDTVTIYGKRWFDRVNGNTYHTAEVEVNGTTLGKSPMTYGYDEQYLETGKEILLQHYDLPRGMTERSPMWQLRDNGVTLTKYVTDGLKRDLAKGGGVKTKNGQTYNYGRVWTKDHNEFDKGSDHEVEYRRKKKFELGGTVVTDLAGHTGGGTGGLNAGMPLDGFSNTGYDGLVGETGAMSSGEMFAKGGSVDSKFDLSGYKKFRTFNDLEEAKEYVDMDRKKYSRAKESVVIKEGNKFQVWVIPATGIETGNRVYELGGGLPSGVSQPYMITEALGNPAQHFAKGGGVRIKNGQTYNYGRVWTKDHNEFDKGADHEVEYRRKKSFFAKGGAMEKIKYDDVLEVLKEKLEGAIEDLPMDYENSYTFTGEEVEKESRDGFIAFTDGGYEVNWFEYVSQFSGSGKSLPTKPLDTEMERQVANNYQYAKERFVDDYPEIVEELGEDNIDYNSLYEAGYEDEAEQLSEWEMDYDGEDSIMCEIGAYYFNNNNYRGIEGKHTLRLFGLVNLESPYHRRGNLDDSYDIDITFDSISELKEKVDAGLKEIIDWFDGKYYNDSTTEMKIRRMADGGFMDGVYAKGGGVGKWIGYDKDHLMNTESGMIVLRGTDLKDIKPQDIKGYDMLDNQGYAKGGKVSPFKNIMETNTITEKEINLIKMRMNNDKVDEATQEVIDYIWDNSPQLTPDQNKKGIDYLRNLWKSPTGKERTNNPFGYREQDTLETFEYFELRGFYDAGNRYRKFYVPLYTCVGADSSFEYAFYGGEVNILG